MCENRLISTPLPPPLSDPCPSRHSQHPASCALTSASTQGRSPSSVSTAAKPSPRTQPTTATCAARTARRRAPLARCAASTSRSRRTTTSTWRFTPLISQKPHGCVLDQLCLCIGLCACVCAWLRARCRRRWHWPLQQLFGYIQSLNPGLISECRGWEFLTWVPRSHTGMKSHMRYPTFPFLASHTLISTKGKHRQEGISPPWTIFAQISLWGLLAFLWCTTAVDCLVRSVPKLVWGTFLSTFPKACFAWVFFSLNVWPGMGFNSP